jgi:hypothetical protein
MVSYKVINKSNVSDVLEIETNQIIKNNIPTQKAKELCRHLNFGGGFDGHTPAFFLENITPVNEELV